MQKQINHLICIREELCFVVSISWAVLGTDAKRHEALTHVAQEVHPGSNTEEKDS